MGVIITWGTYSAANPGDRFLVAWGAIVFGGYRFMRGLYYLADPPDFSNERLGVLATKSDAAGSVS